MDRFLAWSNSPQDALFELDAPWVSARWDNVVGECDTLPECDDCPYFTDENIPATEWETLYARDLGKATLTDEEKRDAILDALCRDLAHISARCEDGDWKPDL
jgi:hypothetical protein